MEVYFVDVGMGNCHVILLGNRRAILIDGGVKSDYLALHFLKQYGIDRIVRLITSHSDNDHIGGAIAVLGDYQDRIDEVHVIQDSKFLATKYWQRIQSLNADGVLLDSQIKRLEIPEEKPKILWQEGEAKLTLLSPCFMENQIAQRAMSTNATSAVLVLEQLNSRIVFAADSVIEQWRKIYDRRDQKPISCDILCVPHHGGQIGDSDTDLRWLYNEALRTNVAIVSVGGRKTPKHPRKEVIRALTDSSAKVMCTQITSQCHGDLESVRPSILSPMTLIGKSHDAHSRKQIRKKCIGCAGTVLATLDSNGCTVKRLAEHQLAVDLMTKSPQATPLCRSVAN